jgi:hypothetical protein
MTTAIQKEDKIPTLDDKSVVKVATHKGRKSSPTKVPLVPLKRSKFVLDDPNKAFAFSDQYAKIMDEASRWSVIRNYDYSR